MIAPWRCFIRATVATEYSHLDSPCCVILVPGVWQFAFKIASRAGCEGIVGQAVRCAVLVLLCGACSPSRSRVEATGTRVGPSPQLLAARPGPVPAARGPALQVLDRHETGIFNRSAAEIVDYHAPSRRAFVVNADAALVTVLELGPSGFHNEESALEPARDVAGFRVGTVNSLAVGGELVAVALSAREAGQRGRVAFYAAATSRYLGSVEVGFGPDMLTFTPDAARVVVANEGEQSRNDAEQIRVDPEGSVSVIDVSRGVAAASVRHATFERFEPRIEEYRNMGVRVPRIGDSYFESGAGKVSLCRDLEPEYVAIAPDGKTAYVSLQENDTVAVLDVEQALFTELIPLGSKDFSVGMPSLQSFALEAHGQTALIGFGSLPPASAERGLWFDARESRGSEHVFYALRGDGIQRVLLTAEGTIRSARLPLGGVELGRARGLVRNPRDGMFWVGDDRRPVAHGVGGGGREPRDLVARGPGGVEALAFDEQRQRLFMLTQGRGDGAEGLPRVVHVAVLDADAESPRFGQTLSEHLHVTDAAPARVRAAVYIGNDQLLLAEQSGVEASATIYHLDLKGATDVAGIESAPGLPLEACGVDQLSGSYGVDVAHERKVLSLSGGSGKAFELGGLGWLGDGRVAVLGGPEMTLGPTPGQAHAGAGTPTGVVLGLVSFDEQNRFDASDRDGAALLRRWPVLGGYMPDAIRALRAGGREYFVTANEGDTRGYDAKRLADVELDPRRFRDAAALQSKSNLGRLKISAFDGDLDGDGDFDEIHTFGSRSISVWSAAGELVYDSGSLFEDVTALGLQSEFNSNNDDNSSFDTRSDDRGPEPEGLEVAEIGGRTYAFVGLERVGGIVVLDLTDPLAPVFVEYVNPRDFAGSAAQGSARDLGPEGLKFVPAAASPTGRGLLLVGNEVSGTTTAYHVNL